MRYMYNAIVKKINKKKKKFWAHSGKIRLCFLNHNK